MIARAVVLRDPSQVEVAPVEVPDLRDGDVLVRTRSSGISGKGELSACGGGREPCGWSAVGRVVESRDHIPEGALVFAAHPHQDLFVVPVTEVVLLDGVRPRLGTLLPAAVKALEAIREARVAGGETVVVLGLGPAGAITAVLLRSAGARVIGADRAVWRRRAADTLGLITAEPEGLEDAVGPVPGRAGADLVIDAEVDDHGGYPRASRLMRPDGRQVRVAHGRPERPHAGRLAPLYRDPLWIRARELLDELPISVLATHDFPFERAEDAYRAVAEGEDGLIHAALHYP